MPLRDLLAATDLQEQGAWMYDRVHEWYPICRSITGQGLRDTLESIGKYIPLSITAVPTGTPVFDWAIPNEWNIRDAFIKNSRGERVVDFQKHNLHVMGYSIPVRVVMSLDHLRPHLHTHPDNPEWIPYRTSYYKEDWGFCLSQRTLDAMTPGDYEVVIDSTLAPGELNYAECLIRGEEKDEVLISSHACHPSLANDNLSGIALSVAIARLLQGRKLRHSYRFLFAPGTIGAIAWLSKHEEHARRLIRHGLIFACVGDDAPFQYKQSRRGNAHIDRAVEHVLATSGHPHTIHPFSPYGYDERQYCSPGFDLPVGCFMRGGPGGFPEYHSSADNPAIVSPANLADALERMLRILQILEDDRACINTRPLCEPQLGRRGLYGPTGGLAGRKTAEMAMLWILNYSDGHHTLLDIATRANIPFAEVALAADALTHAGLLIDSTPPED